MKTTQRICPNCGKRFQPWREKVYCSERCRKRAEDVRRGGIKRASATPLPDGQKPENFTQQNQRLANPYRGDESFEWTAANEVTQKLTRAGSRDAVGWAMRIGPDWFGRIGRTFSFGPTSLARARAAVEAKLMGQDFTKLDDERSWSGDCWSLIHPARTSPDPVSKRSLATSAVSEGG